MTRQHSNFILAPIGRYYTDKLRAHGATPAGVDWNSETSQTLRFDKLLHLVTDMQPFSIIDYGCGYGALVDFLDAKRFAFRYQGFDIASEMIAVAGERFGGRNGVVFTDDRSALRPADFVVASGIFNVRLDVGEADWREYVHETLDELDTLSARGFAFNALTAHADPERMRADLYYADPSHLLRRCLHRYSRHVALLHDYQLFEFTILVRKH